MFEILIRQESDTGDSAFTSLFLTEKEDSITKLKAFVEELKEFDDSRRKLVTIKAIDATVYSKFLNKTFSKLQAVPVEVGQQFNTLAELARHLGVNPQQVYNAIQASKGCDEKDEVWGVAKLRGVSFQTAIDENRFFKD